MSERSTKSRRSTSASEDAEILTPKFVEHRINQGQGELYVRDYPGDGPPFVALHGFPDNLHIFDELAEHLVRVGRRVITFDFLGFGASDKSPTFQYNFAQQLTDLEAVVDVLHLDRIVPVGHDAGGPTAVNYALDHPNGTSGVCLLNCFYGSAPTLKFPEFIELFATNSLEALTREILADPKQFAWVIGFQRKRMMDRLSAKQAKHYEEFLTPLIDQNFRQTPSAGPAFAQMTSHLFDEVRRNDGRLEELRRLTIPFLLVWGEIDPYLNAGVAEDFAIKVPTSRIVRLSAGHWPQLDEPEAVAQAILRVPFDGIMSGDQP